MKTYDELKKSIEELGESGFKGWKGKTWNGWFVAPRKIAPEESFEEGVTEVISLQKWVGETKQALIFYPNQTEPFSVLIVEQESVFRGGGTTVAYLGFCTLQERKLKELAPELFD